MTTKKRRRRRRTTATICLRCLPKFPFYLKRCETSWVTPIPVILNYFSQIAARPRLKRLCPPAPSSLRPSSPGLPALCLPAARFRLG